MTMFALCFQRPGLYCNFTYWQNVCGLHWNYKTDNNTKNLEEATSYYRQTFTQSQISHSKIALGMDFLDHFSLLYPF